MSNFNEALDFMFAHEGFYSDDQYDAGGATKYGISLRFLKSLTDADSNGYNDGDIDSDGDVDQSDVANMTKSEAIMFYKTYFWDKYNYQKIEEQIIATKLFDLSVNMGPIQAHKIIQRAVRSAIGLLLIEDGVLGPISIDAINTCREEDLICAMRSEAAGFYRSLNNQRFLKGWLNRAYS